MSCWTHITGILPVWTLNVPYDVKNPKYINTYSSVYMGDETFVNRIKFNNKCFYIDGQVHFMDETFNYELSSIGISFEIPSVPKGIFVDVVLGDGIYYLVFHGDVEGLIDETEIRKWWGKLVAVVDSDKHEPFLSINYDFGGTSFILTKKDAIYEDLEQK